jgi:predicted metallo-beta-lactamase superfamily hydrolase
MCLFNNKKKIIKMMIAFEFCIIFYSPETIFNNFSIWLSSNFLILSNHYHYLYQYFIKYTFDVYTACVKKKIKYSNISIDRMLLKIPENELKRKIRKKISKKLKKTKKCKIIQNKSFINGFVVT